MFRKVFKEIGKVFGVNRQPVSAKSASTAAARYKELQAEEEAAKKAAAAAADAPESDGGGSDGPTTGLEGKTAEELCDLKDGMSIEELDDHLKLLYRRHNRAASSLDETKRKEAEIMLDAIVEVRQRYIEEVIE